MWNFLFLAFQWHRGKRGFVILSLAFLAFLLYAVASAIERNGAGANLRSGDFTGDELPGSSVRWRTSQLLLGCGFIPHYRSQLTPQCQFQKAFDATSVNC